MIVNLPQTILRPQSSLLELKQLKYQSQKMTVDNEQKPKPKPKPINIGGSTAVNVGETTKFQPCMRHFIYILVA